MNNITRKRYSLNKFGFEEYTEHEVKNFSNGRTFFAKEQTSSAICSAFF